MMLMTLPAFALSLFMNNEWILGRTMCKLLPCLMDIGKLSAPIFVAAIALHQTYDLVQARNSGDFFLSRGLPVSFEFRCCRKVAT